MGGESGHAIEHENLPDADEEEREGGEKVVDGVEDGFHGKVALEVGCAAEGEKTRRVQDDIDSVG